MQVLGKTLHKIKFQCFSMERENRMLELLKLAVYELITKQTFVLILEYIVKNQQEDGYTCTKKFDDMDDKKFEPMKMDFLIQDLIDDGHIERHPNDKKRIKLTNEGMNFLIEIKTEHSESINPID